MKFSLKKLAVICLSAVGIGTTSFGLAACMPKSADLTEPENLDIIKVAPPTDGSLPTAHTATENLAYINYVFGAQKQYHSYCYGVTAASIATQTTRTWKDYKDGVLLSTDITYSSMVKTGTQMCTVLNDEGVYDTYFRTSETPTADTVPTTAEWSQEAPLYFDERGHHYTYGLLPTELSVYIINEQNITSSEAVQVNADGTYTLNFTLDPVASTYYYQFGMKTRGGLSGYPEFQTIDISFTFDEKWQIISSTTHEVSTVNKGVVVSSVSDFSTEYFYGDNNFDGAHFGYYDQYYKQYLGDETLEPGSVVEDKPVMDVTNVLSNGFSTVMNGGQQFEIQAELGKNKFAGYAFATLDLADPLGTLAIKASLGRNLDKQDLYIEFADGNLEAYYGNDFALTANLAEVKLAAGQFSEFIERIKNVFTGGGDAPLSASVYAEEEADPLTALMNSMVLEAGESHAVLTLDTDDLLGLGIGINARLVFGVNGNAITFRGGTISDLTIGGEPLDLSLTILTTTAPLISHEKAETPANLADYVADVYNLLDSDLLKVSVNLNGDGEQVKIKELKGVNLGLTAYADIDEVAVGGDLALSYNLGGNEISADLSVRYDYDPASDNYGKAILSLTNLNGAPADVRLVCDIKELADGISTVLMTGGLSSGVSLDGIVPVINGALSVNMIHLLSDLYADGSKIKLSVSIDTLLKMFDIDAGVEFGTVALQYERGEEGNGGALSAALPALGLDLCVEGAEGELPAPNYEGCLDLNYVVSDVLNVINSEYIEIALKLDGDAEGVNISQLGGIDASLNAYVALDGSTVAASAGIAYTHGTDKISANIVAGYVGGDASSGRITVGLTAINGAPTSAYITCDIDELIEAIGALLDRAGISLDPFKSEESDLSATLAPVLSNVLSADFSALLPEIATDEDGLYLGVNIDEVVALFGLETGIEFGTARLAYSTSEEEKLLTATLPAFGVTVTVEGVSEHNITLPAADKCLDLTDVVNTVNAAWEQVDEIIKAQAVNFTIGGDNADDAYLNLDGITVNIAGEGEVSWKEGDKYVALDLIMSLTERATDSSTVRLYYSENAPADKPFVRLAIDGVGIDIYRSDIKNTVDGFNSIYEKVAKALGLNKTEEKVDNTTPAQGGDNVENSVPESGDNVENNLPAGDNNNENTSPEGGEDKVTAKDRIISMLFGVLAKQDWVNALNNLTLTSDGKSVTLQIAGERASEVEIGADGELSLIYDIAIGSRFTMSGNYTARAVDGYSLAEALNDKDGVFKNNASSKDGTTGFIKLVYDFLFDAIEGMSVENILGNSTYNVELLIDGSKTGEAKLQNTRIEAKILVSNETYENENEKGKIAEGYLNIDVEGVVIELSVITERRGDMTRFYMNLSRVMNIKLPDLKFMATQESLYDTIKILIDTINDTNVLDKLGSLLNSGKEEEKAPATDGTTTEGTTTTTTTTTEVTTPVQEQEKPIEKGTVDKVADLLEKLLNFKLDSVVTAWKDNEDNTFHGEINLDSLLSQLGIAAGEMGVVEIDIDHDSHAMSTSAVAEFVDTEGNVNTQPWIQLSSFLDPVKADYSDDKFNRNTYLSIEFLPTLIDDLVKFATNDNGVIYDKFTLSGSVRANINIKLTNYTLNIDNITVTVGIKDGLYVSAAMHVQEFSAALGIVQIPECTVGLTYENGYLTLAKGLNGNNPEYKIMTFDYFIDHLLVENGSVLEWLLNVKGWGVLNLALQAAKVNISSGLTQPQDVYLYDKVQSVDLEEISIYDYINAIQIKFSDDVNAVTDFDKSGEMGTLINKFGLTDDYYAFALNSELLTGGAVKQLYAALTRNAVGGLKGVMAYGNVADGILDFGLNLDYKENVNNDYLNGALGNDRSIGSFYKAAMAKLSEENKKVFDIGRDKTTGEFKPTGERFGCFSTADMKHDPSVVLEGVKLTIHRLDETGAYTDDKVIDVRKGSDIYLYDNNSPVYADKEEKVRILYSTNPATENYLTGTVIQDVTTNIEVWEHHVDAVVVSIVNVPNADKIKDLTKLNTENAIVVNSFVGDFVPTSVNGLDTIYGPYYKDSGVAVASNTPITSAKIIHLYGTFVESVKYVNNIQYTFDKAKSGYVVTGKGAGFNGDYTETETTHAKTIYLENEIGGYPVVAIGEKAFANTENKPIERIVVPKNIKEVGQNAFLDNVDMESAVFLADDIVFCGSVGTTDKTMPFYGCSSSNDDERTNLKVYVNNVSIKNSKGDIVAGTSYDWLHFRTASVGSSLHYRKYIGNEHSTGMYDANAGGEVHLTGKWNYYQYDIVCGDGVESSVSTSVKDLVLGNYTEGATTKSYSLNDIQSLITTTLDEMTAESEQCIDKYSVSVTSTKNSYGATVITVNVELSAPEHVAYRISLEECTLATPSISGDNVRVVNGKTYASGTFNVTYSDIAAGYSLDYATDGTTVVSQNPATFTADGVKTISAQFKANLVNVQIISAISFTYAGVSYRGETSIPVATENDVLMPVEPQADGYAFLGWAVADGNGNLTITTLSDKNLTYYIVWGTSTNKTVTASANGSTLPTPVGKDGSGRSFENCWYLDSAFNTKVGSLTTQTTVLHAREIYTATLVFDGDKPSVFKATGSINKSETVTDFTLTFNLLEGESFTVEFVKQTGSYIISSNVYTWNNAVINYNGQITTVSAYKEGNNNNKNRRTFRIENNGETITTGGTYAVNNVTGNVTVTMKY